MSQTNKFCITAVILSYNSLNSLLKVIEAIKSQSYPVTETIIIDNGSSDGTQTHIKNNALGVKLISLEQNSGVGLGHSTGWQEALKNPACNFIWSVEHDCIPYLDCLEQLVSAYLHYDKNRLKLGAIVPLQMADYRLDDEKRFVWRKGRFIRVTKAGDQTHPFLKNGFTFNGTLFPSEVVKSAGYLKSDFFVGQEDIEYRHRLRRLGFSFLGVPKAIVTHDILKSRKKINLFGRTLLIPNEGIIRAYYSSRNVIYLEKIDQGLSRAVIKTILKLPLSLLYIVLMGNQKLSRIKARLFAVRDGLQGNLGRKDYFFLNN